MIMSLVTKKKLDLHLLADIEHAATGVDQNAINIEDITVAMLELGELLAEQDDAIVELADLIAE